MTIYYYYEGANLAPIRHLYFGTMRVPFWHSDEGCQLAPKRVPYVWQAFGTLLGANWHQFYLHCIQYV